MIPTHESVEMFNNLQKAMDLLKKEQDVILTNIIYQNGSWKHYATSNRSLAIRLCQMQVRTTESAATELVDKFANS